MSDRTTDERRRSGLAAHALRRRWRAVVAAAVIGCALAAVFAAARTRTYTASATVFLRPLVGNAFTSDALANSQVTTIALNTEASLVDSAAVTDRVNAALGTHLSAGSSAAHASVPTDTQLVVIGTSGHSAAQAVRYARAYAAAFLDYRASLARANQSATLEQLTAQETAARERLAKTSAAANLPHPAPDATSQLQLATTQLASIETAIGQAEAMDADPGSVVKPAQLDSGGFFGSSAVLILAGLLIGLLVGFLIALWREFRDDRVHAAQEATVEDVPVLALVPPAGSEEATRDVRTAVIAAVPDGGVLAVAPLGAAESDAAADLALALGHSLAAAGYRVVLVDAAIVAPRLGALLEIPGNAGLSDVLMADGEAPEPAKVDALRVLPAGSRVELARERYGGERMAALLAGLRADADLVLVVTPPVESSHGAAVLRAIERIMLVATDGVTRRAQVGEAAHLAERLSRSLVGLVAVEPARQEPVESTEPATELPAPAEPSDEQQLATSAGRPGNRTARGSDLA